MAHRGLMEGNALQTATRGLDAPDVPGAARHPAHEIDVGVVGCPKWEMAMHALGSNVDLATDAAVVADEEWITRCGRVVHDLSAIVRPGHLGNTRQKVVKLARSGRG